MYPKDHLLYKSFDDLVDKIAKKFHFSDKKKQVLKELVDKWEKENTSWENSEI